MTMRSLDNCSMLLLLPAEEAPESATISSRSTSSAMPGCGDDEWFNALLGKIETGNHGFYHQIWRGFLNLFPTILWMMKQMTRYDMKCCPNIVIYHEEWCDDMMCMTECLICDMWDMRDNKQSLSYIWWYMMTHGIYAWWWWWWWWW